MSVAPRVNRSLSVVTIPLRTYRHHQVIAKREEENGRREVGVENGSRETGGWKREVIVGKREVGRRKVR